MNFFRNLFLSLTLSLLLPGLLFAEKVADRAVFEVQLETASGAGRIVPLLEYSALLREEGEDSLAREYCSEALELALAAQQHKKVVEAFLGKAEAEIGLNKFDWAIETLEQGLETKDISTEEEAGMLALIGEAYHLRASYLEAEYYLLKSLNLFKSSKNMAEAAGVHIDLGENYRFMSRYDQAAIHLFQALNYFEEVGDSDQVYQARESIAILAYLTDHTDRALELESQCVRFDEVNRDSVGLGYSYTIMSLIFYKLNDFEKSEDYALRSLRIREAIGDVRGQGESWNNLAIAYMNVEKWDTALVCLENSLKFLTEGNDLRQIATILGNTGEVKRKQGNLREALIYYRLAIGNALRTGQGSTLRHVYPKVSRTYVQLGDYRSAYEFQGEYIQLLDSLNEVEQERVVQELDFRYRTTEKEQEIDYLRERQKTSNLIFWSIVIGGVVILSLLVLVFILRMRQATLDQELAAEKLNSAHRELREFTGNVLRKNKLIEELEEKLATLELEDKQSQDQRAMKVQELLEMKILTDEDWSAFKRLFEEVHQGFSVRLKETFPNLTVGETRLFILLKLNLSSREISNILGVSPDSVKKARYRLRKKLQLTENEKLQEFVANFQ